MKIRKREGGVERQILIACITQPQVLAKVLPHWEEGLFQSQWGNLIATWCVDYFKQYGEAPERHVEHLFRAWANTKSRDQETRQLVEDFLGSLSQEYESKHQQSAEYLVDLAANHFNQVKLKRLSEAIQGHLDAGELQAALGAVQEFGKVELGAGAGVDLLLDDVAIEAVFQEQQQDLVTYPGGAGEFFAGALTRNSFVAFLGAEKRGKSFLLQDLAWRAMLQRRKVAYFEVGDMSQDQVYERFLARAANAPFLPDTLKIPKSITLNEEGPQIEFETKVFERGLNFARAKSARDRVLKRIRSKESYFKLSCHPNSTISVLGIKSVLDGWAKDGFVCDVLICDYADILAPLNGKEEHRHQINATWKALRGLSQELHCLVVTATQADAKSYGAHTLSLSNFTEDKRKYAHVTGMVGINCTQEEYELEIRRLNWLVRRRRNSRFSPYKCCTCAGCYGVANPIVKSVY